EGLQHQDGHSLLFASAYPHVRAYDPAFAYELAIIIRDGIRYMFEDQQTGFYYLTIYNENYPQPPMPEGAEQGILKGLYKFRSSAVEGGKRVQLIGSGTILREVLR